MKGKSVAIANRSGELDFWKLIFAFVVVILHSEYLPVETEYTFLHGGSIGVEFFFIASGYLMAKSTEKKNNYLCLARETKMFLCKKVQAFFPYMLFGFCASLITKVFYYGYDFLQLVKNTCNGIMELLLLKSTGISNTIFNSPMWYLSAMILSMAILYPLSLKYKESFKQIVCPLISFFLLGYLYQKYGHFRSPDVWDGLFFKGTIRGFAEISLGIFCREVGREISKFQFTKFSKILFTIIEYGSLSAIVIHSNTESCWDMDVASVLLIAISIIIICENLSILSDFWNGLKFTPHLGKYSLMIYINHIYWVWIFDVINLQMNYKEMLAMYLLCSIMSAFVCWFVVDRIVSILQKNKAVIKSLFIKE